MRRFRLLPTVMAAATLLVLLAFLGIVRQNLAQMRTLRDETALIEHTLQVQRELDRVQMQVSEADSGARRYLLTPGDEALAEFAQARTNLETSLTRLQQLTADNPQQQARIERMRTATNGRLQAADRIFEVRRTQSLEAALELARTLDVARWRGEIRDVAAELERSEAALLEQRRVQADQAYTLAVNGRVGSGIVSASLLIGLVALYLVGSHTDFAAQPMTWCALLSGLIIYYNYRHKRDPLSPLVMALCRVMVYLVSASVVGTALSSEVMIGGAVLAGYLIGLTYIAKQENLTEIKNLWPLLFLSAPVVYLFRGANLLAGIALAAAAASAGQATPNLGCGTGKLVVRVHYRVLNEQLVRSEKEPRCRRQP